MAHDYQSFLVRCWQLGDGTKRIAVEHVQSGERTLVASLDAATAWLSACVAGASPGAAPATDEPASPLAYPPRPPGGNREEA
jgi:hypothetical protein